MAEDWTVELLSLLDAPSPAVLTTYRKDGSALVSPVWFRWLDGAFEVVIAGAT
jgi:Pyridoxamine 5'-phosphate oxidase